MTVSERTDRLVATLRSGGFLAGVPGVVDPWVSQHIHNSLRESAEEAAERMRERCKRAVSQVRWQPGEMPSSILTAAVLAIDALPLLEETHRPTA
jgi:hypothetical protein